MESNAAERFIAERLKADPTIVSIVGTRIYNTRRPPEEPLPCIVFSQYLAGPDLMSIGGIRIWAPMLYLVVGLANQNSYAGNLLTLANRIDFMLHGKSQINPGGTVHSCVRQRTWQGNEVVTGQEFRRLGGIYEILAS